MHLFLFIYLFISVFICLFVCEIGLCCNRKVGNKTFCGYSTPHADATRLPRYTVGSPNTRICCTIRNIHLRAAFSKNHSRRTGSAPIDEDCISLTHQRTVRSHDQAILQVFQQMVETTTSSKLVCTNIPTNLSTIAHYIVNIIFPHFIHSPNPPNHIQLLHNNFMAVLSI
jgi:hypothetical protein